MPVHGDRVDAESVRLACSLARKTKGRIYVVYVIQVKRTLPLDADIASETLKAEEVLERAERLAEEKDYEVETDLLQAREVGPAIVDEAVERGVDLIIMGVGYRRRFGEFDLGSAVPHVLKNAPCRVWICREPMEGERP